MADEPEGNDRVVPFRSKIGSGTEVPRKIQEGETGNAEVAAVLTDITNLAIEHAGKIDAIIYVAMVDGEPRVSWGGNFVPYEIVGILESVKMDMLFGAMVAGEDDE